MSEQLAISQIRRDGGTQPRLGLHTETVMEYAEAMRAGAVFPDVVVFYDGKEYWLADGFHRVAAVLACDHQLINADVRQGQRRDAVLYSVGANSDHGLRRNNADKRRAVETLLRDEEWCKWSDREIARRAAVSQPFVSSVRAELFPVSDNGYQIERTVERNGTTYTMNVGKRDSVFTDEEWAEMNRVESGKPAKKVYSLGTYIMITENQEIGLIVGADDSRFAGRVCVRRPNGVGFMTHWIGENQLTYPVPAELMPKDLHTTKLWRWNSALMRAANTSRESLNVGGWFRYSQGNWDRELMDELIDAGMIDVRDHQQKTERVRLSYKGAQWMGREPISYPAEPAVEAQPSQPFTVGAQVITVHTQLVGTVKGYHATGGVIVHVHDYQQDVVYKPESLELHTSQPAADQQPVIEQPAAVDQQPDDEPEEENAEEVFTEAMNWFFDGEDILETAPTLYRVLAYANGTINADEQLLSEIEHLICWLHEYQVQIQDETQAPA